MKQQKTVTDTENKLVVISGGEERGEGHCRGKGKRELLWEDINYVKLKTCYAL